MPPRSMDRSITTCRNCRRRKIRCDRSRPQCNRCRESGALCLYEDQVPQPAPTYHFVEETPGTSTSLSRTSTHSREPTVPQETPTVTMSQERLRSIEARVESLSRMVRDLQAQTSGQTSSTARSATDASALDTETAQDQVGYLSQQPDGRVRYVEQTFWASMTKEVADLDELLEGQASALLGFEESNNADDWIIDLPDSGAGPEIRLSDHQTAAPAMERDVSAAYAATVDPHSRDDTFSHPPSFRPGRLLIPRTIARYPDFLAQLPPKALADSLLEGYIQSYHPMVPLIHVPTFRARYEAFWATVGDPDATTTASMAFAALVIACLHAGSVACPERIGFASDFGSSPHEAALRLQQLGLRAVRLSYFPKIPTLDNLTSYMILQSTLWRVEEPLQHLAFMGIVVRIGTLLGLHSDPSHFPRLDPIEAEVRRRLWWHIVHFDVNVAIASGLPPIIDTGSWDVQGTTEVKEELWGTRAAMEYEAGVFSGPIMRDHVEQPGTEHRSMVSTSGILVAGKLKATLVIRRTLAHLFTGGPPSVHELVAMRAEFRVLADDLNQRIARIPTGTDNDSTSAGTFENNTSLNRWARILLSAFIDQKYTLLCHPLLKSANHATWADLYALSINHAQAFLHKHAQLAAIPLFRNFQWSYPGNHQPLHAIAILLLDLLSTPAPAESPVCIASKQVLDLILALCAPEGGIVGSDDLQHHSGPFTQGGKENWDLLRRLRAKAWAHAGWDPGMVWSRERAIAYCNREDEVESVQTPPGVWSPGGLGGDSQQDFAEGIALSPPNIDWAYLDAVLEGSKDPMDLGFDFGIDEGV